MHSFQGAMTQEIQLQIVKAPRLEIIHVIPSHLSEAGMSRIDRNAAIEDLHCGIGGPQVGAAPFVSAASGHETIGPRAGGPPINERRPINTRLLTVGMAKRRELLQLGIAEIVPK